jgi:outer membrane protein assembly factor BamB
MMHHDQYHTGRSPYDGPKTAALKWAFQTGNNILAAPAVAADGTIYIPSVDGYLYAVNPDGTEKWKFFLTAAFYGSPAIGADGTVYLGTFGEFFAINPDGTLRWKTDQVQGADPGPVIASDGTIHIGDRESHLFAFYPDGTLKWMTELGPDFWFPPSVGPDGVVYIGADFGNLYAVYPNGILKWTLGGFGFTYRGCTSFSVEDSTLYTGGQDDTLYALTPDGELKWTFPTGDGIIPPPCIGADGAVYFGSEDYTFYALNPDGSLRWSLPTTGKPSSSVIDSSGTVYFGTVGADTTGNRVYAVNPDGSILWSRGLPARLVSAPAIGADGTLYIGCEDGNLYAFGTPTAVDEIGRLRAFRYELRQNKPNPFVSSGGGTAIHYGLAKPGNVSLKVYDVSGRLVQTLVQEKKKAGFYTITWDGKDSRNREVASGVYFYKIQAGNFGDVKKMVLLR